MNRKDFLDIMENPIAIDRHNLSEIEEMVSLFPYFQSAHLLLLKGLHGFEDVKFGITLRNSALHIADREKLYHLLYSAPVAESVPVQPDNEAGEYTDSGQTVIESAMNSEELINTIENSINLEAPDEEAEEVIPQVLEDFEDPIEVPVKSEDETMNDEELLELDNELQTDSNIDSRSEAGEKPSMMSPSDLIDRFIIANPRIEPIRDVKPVAADERPEPPLKEGVFVSETLARIYISQGYYSKAIDVLEKLSLKYPEKSSYFATQIEKVKELLK